MLAIRFTMHRLRETSRMHLQSGLTYNEGGDALKVSMGVYD